MIRQTDLTAPDKPRLTVVSLLQKYVPQFISANRGSISPHTLNILARISLCRSSPMGRRRYHCADAVSGADHGAMNGAGLCDGDKILFNSCGERSCPLCHGARRLDWLETMTPTILPGINYFQIVLTIPHEFSDLILANPSELYSLLMRSAWKSIRKLLKKLGIAAGATMVLHTWNQRLQLHPHVHVLIPAGGLSLDGTRWIHTGAEEREFLQERLGKTFRYYFIKGIISLHRCGHLWLAGVLAQYDDRDAMKDWLSTISPPGFRVLVQVPPAEDSTPEHVLKYLASYICGGPISDYRLVSDSDGMVTFMARSLKKPAPGEPHAKVPVTIPGPEFVRRWALHILPKFLFRVRNYGKLSNPHRAEYLERCKKLLGVVETQTDPDPPDEGPPDTPTETKGPRCPKCGRPMKCVEMSYRPSWKITMAGPNRPAWYSRAERYSDYSRRFTSSHPP